MPIPSRRARAIAKAALRAASSGALRFVGVDATTEFGAGASVVVAPHPDDETFGCGATIARLRAAGAAVRVVFVSGGGASPAPPGWSTSEIVTMREAEARHAVTELGVDPREIDFLGFDDGRLPQQVDDIAGALQDVIAALAPARVLVTSSRDRHPDHSAVAHATRAAVGQLGAPRSDAPQVFEYPIWQRAPGLAAARRPGARPLLVRTDGFLERKRAAIRAYPSQLPHLPVGFVEDFLVGYESFVPVPL